uniref:tRNA-intron lyase n=1 Tax=Kwoniella dejecticola CBS 10117 TaxID=1296121 RepID=A0A1A6AAQ0_9TREE|nr:uncharacterized protein I303_03149 [Kwoniella dejecticola CBS 10117]OBR87125.1 hypothetical protein I303_03149 [Kwoniella dejecticola CBS 10117]
MSTSISTAQSQPTLATSSGSNSNSNSNTNNQSGKNAARARNQANQRRYANPLPILFNVPHSSASSSSSSAPSRGSASASKSISGSGSGNGVQSVLSSYIPSFSGSGSVTASRRIEVPECIGTFDPITRSVWIEDERSKAILFNRGFFGKGSLSRSEPSWKERRVALLKGGATLAAEQMREARRQARKQFKIDRAAAMLDAAKQAEAMLTSSVKASASASTSMSGSPSPSFQNTLQDEEGEQEEEDDLNTEIDDQPRPDSPTPSTSTATTTTTAGTGTTEDTVIDPMNLTPQTFLVRPTRPDSNRNRGKKAFRRRPPQPQVQSQQPFSSEQNGPPSNVAQPSAPVPVNTSAPKQDEDEDEEEPDLFDESLVEDVEHLQLSLEEALFLSLGLGVLRVFDPATQTYVPNGPSLLSLLLTPPTTPSISATTLSAPTPFRMLPDDPLLVSYIAYHHFRSLGWVVKDGIKFCCDWLLYRRGPAFSHSAFACVVIPVYEDPAEKQTSPYGNEDWYDERLSWKWINTIMRTVIAVYVTIPALKSFEANLQLDNGSLDPFKVNYKQLLQKYTVREVSLTRFGPSRRRD